MEKSLPCSWTYFPYPKGKIPLTDYSNDSYKGLRATLVYKTMRAPPHPFKNNLHLENLMHYDMWATFFIGKVDLDKIKITPKLNQKIWLSEVESQFWQRTRYRTRNF